MKSKKLLRLIFSLALVTLTFLSIGAPEASAVQCDNVCYRVYQYCLTNGGTLAECEQRFSDCLDNCNGR